MKCIYCGRDSKLKERPGGRCPGCSKSFAFEPTRGDVVTDVAFKKAIDAVSGDQTVQWGVEHLYYELARRRARTIVFGPIGCGVVALLLFAAAYGFSRLAANTGEGGWTVWVAGGLGVLAVISAWTSGRAGRAAKLFSLEKFNELWPRWVSTHGQPPTVIVRRKPSETPRLEVEPDLHEYSFDRVVVCDRARTVDLLLANDFHFENNCAVLAITGYPQQAFESVRAMLRRNPKLEVFALHDATPFGCRIAHRLSTDPEWFAGGPSVTDVGLRPGQCRPWRLLWLPSEVEDVQAGGGLEPSEARWLSRYRLELAALRPQTILRQAFQALVAGDDDVGQSFG